MGRVSQFGPTSELYHRPNDFTSANVFSDPPINAAQITKTGTTAHLNLETSWELSGEAAALRDGVYQVAVRPNHVAPVQNSNGLCAVDRHRFGDRTQRLGQQRAFLDRRRRLGVIGTWRS